MAWPGLGRRAGIPERAHGTIPSGISEVGTTGRNLSLLLHQVPEEEIAFPDLLQGEYAEQLARDCGDFILRRSDGVYAYQLAVVVDDAAMGVTQVVRGRDLLSSSPRQIWLQEKLGLPHPEYGHLPLLLAPDGRRLAKRDRDLELGRLQVQYTAPQLVGRLACAANLIDRPQAITPRELLPLFAWDKLPREDFAGML